MDVGVKINIHSQLESIDCQVFEELTEAASVIVDQYLNGSMFLNDALPSLNCVVNVCEISLVKVNFLETSITCNLSDILKKLRCQVFRDVDYDDVDAFKLISAHELFGKLLSKTLRGTSDQNICAVFDCESFL